MVFHYLMFDFCVFFPPVFSFFSYVAPFDEDNLIPTYGFGKIFPFPPF